MEIPEENDFPINLKDALLRIVENEAFVDFEIDKRRVSNDGSYLGTLYEIEVTGRTKDEEKELHLFVKQMTDFSLGNFWSLPHIYANETFAYKELFKIFAELQELANVPLEERYQTVKIYEDSYEGAVIMENIRKKGFTANQRINMQSIYFFEEAIKELAKFHGLSFVLRETKPKYFAEKIKPIKHPITFNEDYKKFALSLRDIGMNYVDDTFKDKLDKVYQDLPYKYAQYSHDETLKVCLRHGDYKFNNLMTRQDEGEKLKVIPIDYQLMHYGNPVFDFLLLIFSGTNRKFRQTHLLNLKDLYHETLGAYLKYFNLDVDTVYPREDFEKVYKEKLDYALFSAAWSLPLLFVAEDAVPDVAPTERLSFPCDVEIRSRLKDVLEEFIEWGYI